MKTAVIALDRSGAVQAARIACELKADAFVKHPVSAAAEIGLRLQTAAGGLTDEAGGFSKCVFDGGLVRAHPIAEPFGELVESLFLSYEGLVFIMACGIVVRSIAPYIKSKTEDPAVVVADAAGRYAVSLLSGHIGGANRLAQRVAAVTGGVPVITTATDTNGVIAFDVFARDNGCAIENMESLKHISAELVNGGKVCLYTDCGISGPLPPNVVRYGPGADCRAAVVLSNSVEASVDAVSVLFLRPGNLIVGIGCKRGKSAGEVSDAVADFLKTNGKSILSVRRLASLDLKAKEPGIVDFCRERGIEFVTFSPERIKPVEAAFTQSEFVRGVTGVGSVAEACAVLAGKSARLICPKTVYEGITLALAEEEMSFRFEKAAGDGL